MVICLLIIKVIGGWQLAAGKNPFINFYCQLSRHFLHAASSQQPNFHDASVILTGIFSSLVQQKYRLLTIRCLYFLFFIAFRLLYLLTLN
jgi:hypothetical protein